MKGGVQRLEQQMIKRVTQAGGLVGRTRGRRRKSAGEEARTKRESNAQLRLGEVGNGRTQMTTEGLLGYINLALLE